MGSLFASYNDSVGNSSKYVEALEEYGSFWQLTSNVGVEDSVDRSSWKLTYLHQHWAFRRAPVRVNTPFM